MTRLEIENYYSNKTHDCNVGMQLLVTSLEKVFQYGQLTSSARLSMVSCDLVAQSGGGGGACWCWTDGEPKNHILFAV